MPPWPDPLKPVRRDVADAAGAQSGSERYYGAPRLRQVGDMSA